MALRARSPRRRRTPRPSAGSRRRYADRSPGPAAPPAAPRPSRPMQTSCSAPPVQRLAPPAPPPDAPIRGRCGAVKLARIGDLGVMPGRGDRLAQPVGGVLASPSAAAFRGRVHQRVAHRMQPEQPDGLGRRRLRACSFSTTHFGFFMVLAPLRLSGCAGSRDQLGLQVIFRLTPSGTRDIRPRGPTRWQLGDRPQGVAGDCNSLAETHAWFDSWVAHHSVFLKPPTVRTLRNSVYISVGCGEVEHQRPHRSSLI